jgi:hypothetical protein
MQDGKDLQAQGDQQGPAMADQGDKAQPGGQGAAPGGQNSVTVKPAGDEAGIKPVGKKNLAAVFIAASEKEKAAGGAGRIVKFSDQEAAVLRSFLRTQNYEETAREVGIKKDSVQRILRRPNLKLYLEEIIQRAAIAEGTDLQWMLKELRLVWEGQHKADPIKMQAMKQMADLVKPRGPGLQVNVQQNAFYAGMGKEAIDAEWADARTTAAERV